MDAGIWRRLIVIPEAKIDGKSDIKNYADHFYCTAGGAILAWIMKEPGSSTPRTAHLSAPARVEAASAAYREENNWFAQFLGSPPRHRRRPVRTGRRELYQAYRAWAMSTSGWASPHGRLHRHRRTPRLHPQKDEIKNPGVRTAAEKRL